MMEQIVDKLEPPDGKESYALFLSKQQIVRLSGLDRPWLRHLKQLDLSGNTLTDISELRHVRGSLEDLDISSNRIQSLAGIGRLCTLKRLNIARNQIRHVPEQLKLLPGLAWLDMAGNKLTNLGQTCTRLQECRRLFWLRASGNPFCSNPSYRKVVASALAGVVYLDEVVLNHVIEDAEKRRGRKAGEEKGLSDSNQPRAQAEMWKKEVEALREDNERLRSEMDATSQLLARKTSEWAVAEESANRYQQELAFMQIEGAPADVARTTEIHATVDDEMIKEGEQIINEANLQQQKKLDALAEERHRLEKDIASMEPLIAAASKNFADSLNELEVLKKNLASMGETIQHIPAQRNTPATTGAELSQLLWVSKTLEELRSALQEKVEICQDMLVLRTEVLIRDDDNEENTDDPSQSLLERKNQLVARFKTNSSVIQEATRKLENSELNERIAARMLASGPEQLNVEGIAGLSEILESAQEEEREVSSYSAACSERVKLLKASLFAEKNGRVEKENEAEIMALKKQALAVEQKVDTDKAGKSALEEELAVLNTRLNDVELSFLRTRCASFETENQIRVTQNERMLHSLNRKNKAIDACNRTIARLQGGIEQTQQKTPESTPMTTTTKGNEYSARFEQHKARESQTVKTVIERSVKDSATERRKVIYEEIMISERQFVHDLSILVELYITPLRHKGFLTPRETQIICKQFEQLHCFHIVLLRKLQNQTLKAVVNTFHQQIAQLEVYKPFVQEFDATASIVTVRKGSSKGFASWLRSVQNKPEAEEKSLESLMSRPLEQLGFYIANFSRLLELTNDADRTALRAKLMSIKSTLERISGGEDINVAEVRKKVAGLASLQRLRKGKTMESTEYDWLMKFRNHPVQLLGEIPMVDVTLILQDTGETDHVQLHVKRATLVLLSTAMVVCKAPKQWSPSFGEEKPQLSACAVLTGGFFTCTNVTEDGEFSSVHLQSTCPLQRVSEALIRFCDPSDHELLIGSVNRMTKAKEPAWSISCADGKRRDHQQISKNVFDITQAQFSSPDKVLVPANGVSKLPGLNMLERRRIAEEIRKQRGVWLPAEQEKLTARRARQRIRIRDGLEPESPVAHAKAKAQSPVVQKDKHFSTWTESARRRRHRKSTSSATSNASVSHSKRRSSKSKGWREPASDIESTLGPANWGDSVGIDRSERFDDMREEKQDERPVDMSIFRAPPPKGSVAARSPQERLERFIGLDWQGSEMMKAQFRSQEKRHVQRKH